MTQVILGVADHQPSLGGPVPPQIAVSTTGPESLIGDPYALTYRTGGPIPPHSYRWIHVHWWSYHCFLNGTGSSRVDTDLLLRVRIGAITRTEQLQLPTAFALDATAASSQTAYCQNRPPTH